jgi:hypothetical protein
MAKLFFSYSHKDEEFRNELETHLALLKRQGVISSWHDRRIMAGGDVHGNISAEIEGAQLILLLVSAHFLASDYCYEKEMQSALQRHREGSAVVIPVILHPCDWHSAPFGHLRATPTDGKPISMFANQHEAFSIVAKDVRAVAERFANSRDDERSTPSQGGKAPSQERSSNLRIKRKFDDHERDGYLEDSYEYIARYFEGSMIELEQRNPQIKTRFKRVDATSFSATIYEQGAHVAECSVWYGGDHFGSNSIAYSNSASSGRSSFNESLSVVDDGYTLALRPLGMQSFGRDEEALSQQGAAELFWEIFIRPLQE